VQFRATDNAGNVSAVGSVAFSVVEPDEEEDTTAPTVTSQVSGTRNSAGAYVGSATVTLTATDADSGVTTVEYSLDGGAFTAYTAPVLNPLFVEILSYFLLNFQRYYLILKYFQLYLSRWIEKKLLELSLVKI
jgi:hypothetical protein